VLLDFLSFSKNYPVIPQGEKRENIIRLKVGRYNKMATGGDLPARRLLIESPQPLTPALRLVSDGILGKAQRRRDDKFSLKQKKAAKLRCPGHVQK
jgi:hypothetical protein